MTVDVIIPVYHPGEKFIESIKCLKKQSICPSKLIIINTEKQFFKEEKYDLPDYALVKHIAKEEFDHGGTRNEAVDLSQADIVIFLTDDAVPAKTDFIEKLIKPFSDENVAVTYGRQLPRKNAGEIERFTRKFNYPKFSEKKGKKDLERLGIKTYFCSNVCAAYRRNIYLELGGFVRKTIFNEDMIMASKVIGAGFEIVYTAEAEVIHSHHYSYIQQFQRNFDLGVSQKQYEEIFKGIKSESEGMRLVKQTIRHLCSHKKWYLIPDLILQSGAKFLGYQFGKNYNRLPEKVVLKCTMNKAYWK